MEIKVSERILRVAIVNPHGQFDAFFAAAVRERFEQLLDDGVVNFVIDLTTTLFLDSAGMAVLVSLQKKARQRQGKVALVWPRQEATRHTLTLIGFDRVFETSETVEEGLKFFSL